MKIALSPRLLSLARFSAGVSLDARSQSKEHTRLDSTLGTFGDSNYQFYYRSSFDMSMRNDFHYVSSPSSSTKLWKASQNNQLNRVFRYFLCCRWFFPFSVSVCLRLVSHVTTASACLHNPTPQSRTGEILMTLDFRGWGDWFIWHSRWWILRLMMSAQFEENSILFHPKFEIGDSSRSDLFLFRWPETRRQKKKISNWREIDEAK